MKKKKAKCLLLWRIRPWKKKNPLLISDNSLKRAARFGFCDFARRTTRPINDWLSACRSQCGLVSRMLMTLPIVDCGSCRMMLEHHLNQGGIQRQHIELQIYLKGQIGTFLSQLHIRSCHKRSTVSYILTLPVLYNSIYIFSKKW